MDSSDSLIQLDRHRFVRGSETLNFGSNQSLEHRVDLSEIEITQSLCTEASSNLEKHVVLDKHQEFYLLQDLQTELFQIWALKAELPIFKSTSWRAAYRAWLDLRSNQGHNEGSQNRIRTVRASQSTVDLHDWVDRHRDNPQFGQLVYRRDRTVEDFLQYAVQLSEEVALRWTPGDSAGILTLELISRRQHRLAKWVEPQPQTAIAAALHCAIEMFHQHWAYSPYRFNSEHLARLVTTGHCGSFQTDDLLASWRQTASNDGPEMGLPEILEFNLEAESLFAAAIATHQKSFQDASDFLPPNLTHQSANRSKKSGL
ncbi:hypothetical protein [Altericista sp. CCNU0014]|uniref:hypothetical protein n=1 Tax=Altericista sp. CCNU0014 TaxID=3082949 RepID=UPI00384BBB1E